jgi:DnaA family protein
LIRNGINGRILMQQLALAISAPSEPTLDNFVVGANAELVARLRELAGGASREAVVYLWGEAGSGRSHLLRAVGRAAADPARLHLADDVQALGPDAQIDLFNRINLARETGGAVLAAGDAPPLKLGLREDLRSRLGSGLVYQLRVLDDADKARFLRNEAAQRGLQLADEVAAYLLSHVRRDMATLVAILDALDRYSLERKRPVTLPLVREALAARERAP